MSRAMDNLIDKWLDLPEPDYALLRRYGISFSAAQIVGGVRAAKDGRLILPVFDDPPSIYRSVEDPVLLALLAFDPADPDRWTLWPEGFAVMLGEAALREARYYNEPFLVYRNPLNWLRAGGGGVMPLDWPAFVRAVLWTPEIELVAEDLKLGNEIERQVDAALRCGKPHISVEIKRAAA